MSHTKIPACALATITNIPLVHLHGNNLALDRCAKAIQLSADYKDYAHASLDIINTFHWKNIALVADGKERGLNYFCIRLFLYLLVQLCDGSFVDLFLLFVCCGRVVVGSLVVCSFGHLSERAFVRLVVSSFGRLLVCSRVRVVDCSFGLLVVCSCVRVVALLFGHFAIVRLIVYSGVHLFYLFLSCLFRGSFPRSCLLLRNIPRFKVHIESAAAYRERRHKR